MRGAEVELRLGVAERGGAVERGLRAVAAARDGEQRAASSAGIEWNLRTGYRVVG